MLDHDKKVPRPVRPSDYAVVTMGFVVNLAKAFEVFCEDMYELSIYHSNRKTKTDMAWENMAKDLEKLEEETDGR